MRLMEYFHRDGQSIGNTPQTSKEDIQMKISAREKNKLFMSPSGRDLNLDLYIKMVNEDKLTHIQQTSSNLNRKHSST